MMRKRIESLGLASITSMLLAGCVTLGDGMTTTLEPYTWEGNMAVGSTLEVRGINGPVRAVAASGGEARVTAVRQGRRSDPAEVRIEVVEHTQGVMVCAVYPGQRNACQPGDVGDRSTNRSDVQVTFTVEVPAGVDFTARTSNGQVTAEKLSGRVTAHSSNGHVRIEGGSHVDARTTNGSVTIRTSGEASARTTNGHVTAELGRITGEAPLRFTSTNGSISLTLPAAASVSIEARTSNGGIESDLPITVQGTVNRRQLTGTIGGGGAPLELRTTNGNIRIRGN